MLNYYLSTLPGWLVYISMLKVCVVPNPGWQHLTEECPKVLFVECGFGNDQHGQNMTVSSFTIPLCIKSKSNIDGGQHLHVLAQLPSARLEVEGSMMLSRRRKQWSRHAGTQSNSTGTPPEVNTLRSVSKAREQDVSP
jgi:hypothetical protein